MPRVNRPSIRGRGSDAFFEPGAPATPPPGRPPAPPARRAVKCTFYIWDDQLLGLEELRMRRIRAGERGIDKSDMVREALEAYLKEG